VQPEELLRVGSNQIGGGEHAVLDVTRHCTMALLVCRSVNLSSDERLGYCGAIFSVVELEDDGVCVGDSFLSHIPSYRSAACEHVWLRRTPVGPEPRIRRWHPDECTIASSALTRIAARNISGTLPTLPGNNSPAAAETCVYV